MFQYAVFPRVGGKRHIPPNLVVTPRRLPHPLAIGQAFPHVGSSAIPTIWLGRLMARCLIWYVSTSPLFRTRLAPFKASGSALSDQSWSLLCDIRCRVPVGLLGGLHPLGL